METLDLSLATRRLAQNKELTGVPDYRIDKILISERVKGENGRTAAEAGWDIKFSNIYLRNYGGGRYIR